MVIFNIILLLVAASAAFIRRALLGRIIIILTSLSLIINNIYLLQNSDSLILTEFLGYSLSFNTEALANIFVLMVSILYFATNLYSFCYLAGQEASTLAQDLNPKLHFFFMPLSILATMLVAYAANLMTLFIFYELLTLLTYPLVIQSFSESAKKAGRIYLAMLFTSSSLLLLFAILFIDKNYGISMFQLGGVLPKSAPVKDVVLLLICFVFGFSKTAIFPLYNWLPKAMEAPAPVSALLHAVAVVKTGIFALIKIFVYLFGIDYLSNISHLFPWVTNWLSLLACFTIIFAGFMAATQDTLKKILAYSTVSQLSYMILTLSFVSNEAVIATFMQMMAHSVAKITLFFVAGIIYLATHKTKAFDLQAIFRVLPVPVTLFILAALSVIGLPISIGYITIGNIHLIIHDNMIAVICLAVSSLFSCYYFTKVIYQMLKPADSRPIIFTHSIAALSWIAAFTFALCLLIAFYFNSITSYLAQGI